MPIRTGLIGFGRNGSTMHAGPLAQLPDFTLAAVADIQSSAREKAASHHQCPVYTDYRTMLAEESLDLAVIVTYNHQHAPMAVDCLRAGVDVLVTKPWSVNESEAQSMIRAAKETGRQLLPWLPARWGTQLVRLQELTAGREVGDVFQVRRSVQTFGRRSDWQTRRDHGGGYLLNWGPHIVDQPLQLVNEPIASVYAQMRQILNPGDVEDVFYAALTTVTGKLIVCEHTVGAGPLPDWVVQGSAGTICVNSRSVDVYQAVFSDEEDPKAYRGSTHITQHTETVDPSIYGDEMVIYQAIARALRQEKPYPVTLESALNLTRVLDAIRRSAETKETVHLEEELDV